MKPKIIILLCWIFLVCTAPLFYSCDKDEPSDDITGDKNSVNGLPQEGSVNGHEYVDLGLSVKWAKCNLGANSPEIYGNYYAWAETSTKTSYWDQTYKYYNNITGDFFSPTSSICGTKYDAATRSWGSDWRLPSQKEVQELIDRCEWKAKSISGVKGYEVTGPSGAKIFLPKAGSFTGDDKGAKSGIFIELWTGSYARQNDFYSFAYSLAVSDSRKDVDTSVVSNGKSIRPVTTATADSSSSDTSNNSENDSDNSDSTKDFYETNFDSTAATNKITVKFFFSDRVSSATIKYGSSSSCSSSRSASISAKCAYATISGLQPDKKYYFKCVAKSKNGKSCTTETYPVRTFPR